MDEETILAVRDLEKHYPITEGLLRREVGRVRAVDGVSFDIAPGETFGLVGESGCGKSTTALSLLRLEEPTGGEIRFDGKDVTAYDRRELRQYRRRVQLVLQDPESAMNPRMTIGEAVAEPLRIHGMTDGNRRDRIVADVLERVGLSADDASGYPHEFSGGEKQRIALARALVLNPDLIVADEPTSALDGRTKANVLQLMDDLKESYGVSFLLISHDIDLVRRFCDRIAVMYLGSIVEKGETDSVVSDPLHPYTRALMASVPSIDPALPASETAANTLTDSLPDASDLPTGCRFHPRCSAIIPPTDLHLDQEEWGGVFAFRIRLAEGWETGKAFLESLEESGETVNERIRSSLNIRTPLSDDVAEEAVAAAIAALKRNDLETARSELDALGTTPCERHDPLLTDEHAPHPVACHHFDPDMPGGTGVRPGKRQPSVDD